MNIELSTSNAERRDQTGAANYDLEERLLTYSVRIIRLVEALPASRAGNHVAGQSWTFSVECSKCLKRGDSQSQPGSSALASQAFGPN